MLRYQCEYAKSYSGEAYGARVECKQFVSRELRNCELKGPLSRLFVYIIRYVWIKIMEFDPKWVHMAPYELILRLDGALWLRIISTLKRGLPGWRRPCLPKCAWGLLAIYFLFFARALCSQRA